MNDDTNTRDVARRAFVRRLPVVTLGLAGAVSSLTLSACAGTRYLAPVRDRNGLLIGVDDVGAQEAAFIQAPDMDRPIYLHRSADGSWVAVLASCTHQGCQPDAVAGRLVCPCHGSEFTLGGEVLQGPADRDLVRYDVDQIGDRLLVRTPGSGA